MRGTLGELPRSFINYNTIRKNWRVGVSVFWKLSKEEHINNLETSYSGGINYQNYLYFVGIKKIPYYKVTLPHMIYNTRG